MAEDSRDNIVREPLLDYGDDAFETIDRRTYKDGPGLKFILGQKYVIACALFSSIGGLIFGYGLFPTLIR